MNNNTTLKTAFDIVPVSIVTLNENALISYINKTALSLINKEHKDILNRHFGDSFNCIGSYKNERGCGYGPMCKNCDIRKAISVAFENEQATEHMEINKRLLINNKEVSFWFNISVAPMMVEGKINAVITLLDITEEKMEELACTKSRDYCYNVLDHVPAIIWKINSDLQCEYVNKGWEKFTGIKIEKALGSGLAKIFHFEDLSKCSQAIFESRSKKEPFQFEARVLHNDGVYRTCLFKGKPYYNIDGQFDGYIGTIFDITELKTVKEGLNRYVKLAEITDNIILFVELDGNIVDANNAAIRAYGYTYEELCSMNIYDIRIDRENVKKQMETAGQTEIFFEAIHRRKDGSYFNVEVSSRVINTDNKRILGSIVRDITERKIVEGKLKEQEELFRTVFEQSPIGMAFCTSYGEIINANPMYEKIFERSISDLKILGWESITHPDDLFKDVQKFESYKSGAEKVYSNQKRYIKPDGNIVWGSLTLAPLLTANNTIKMNIAMLEDITERIQAEKKLCESEKFKEVILSNLPGMVYRCNYDREWTMHFVSDGCYELTGYKSESLLYNKELSFNDLINLEYKYYLWNKWSQVLAVRGNLKEEYPITTALGEIKWVFEQGHGIYDENGQVIALEGLIIDITDRKKKEDEIRYLNFHDVLTGLYNRRFLDEQKRMIDKKNCLPISVIVGDINGLKLINDALGHKQGDELIVAISVIIKNCVSDKGMVARTGGDDFSIILPETDYYETNKLMKQIELACNDYISKSKNVMYHTSISLGCATKTNETELLGSIIKNAEDNMYRNKLLQNKSMHSSVISSMKTTLLEKSRETEEHALRLVELSKAIGLRMKLTDEQLNELELLSTLHDIGKIGVSDSIINKPDKLSIEERILMSKHPEIGYRIAMTSKELLPIAECILCHHERYDGKGYPQGIKGNDIPLLSRIIAVVDSYDAMTEDRPYRRAMTKEAAINEIKNNAGTQFDPEIAKIFIDIILENS